MKKKNTTGSRKAVDPSDFGKTPLWVTLYLGAHLVSQLLGSLPTVSCELRERSQTAIETQESVHSVSCTTRLEKAPTP